MKKKIFTFALLLMIFAGNLSAEKTARFSEQHGNTLNLGLGIGGYSGYYGYIGHSLPVVHINYEFDVANNFTLAPFLTLYSYRDYYNNHYYRETVIPVGVKGTIYLDQLLNAGSRWDFYVAGSLGFAIINRSWDDENYYGEGYHETSPLFFDAHVGTEYRLSRNTGLFLDLSNGVSTIGLAFH